MKIGINASFLRKPGTGIGQVTTHFLNALFRLYPDHEFVLYVEEETDFTLPVGVKAELRVIKTLYKRDDLIRKILWEKWSVVRAAKSGGCDAFVCLYQSATIIRGVRHVMVVHDLIPEVLSEYLNTWRKKLYWSLTRRAVVQADQVVTVSAYTASDLEKYLQLSPEKITASLISVDPLFLRDVTPEDRARMRGVYGLPPEYIYIGGGLELRKNVENSIRAYAALLEKDWEIPDLVISGRLLPQLAPLITDVEKLADELHVENRVHVIGYVAQSDLPALYACATLFLFPSSYEGFGMPVLEALTIGTPVITTNVTSIPEVASEYVFYTEGSVAAISASMTAALGDTARLQKMGEDGKAHAQKFTWQTIVDDVIKACQ